MNQFLKSVLENPYYSATERKLVLLSDHAFQVMEKKYLRGESAEDMCLRIAKCAAEARANDIYKFDEGTGDRSFLLTKLTNVFYNLLASMDFTPNSPTIMNAGREFNQLAACFVIPIKDSMEGIFRHAIADMADIQRTGGGTGFDFSQLRPKGSSVKSTGGESSGPVSFLTAFNACTDTIKQGGTRRGANMGIMRCDHPDIMEFINLKSDHTALTNFNLSVAITDDFMKAVEEDRDWNLMWPCGPYITKDNPSVYYKTIKARDLWNKIAELAWAHGEPGLIFIDTVNENNPIANLGYLCATNPCVTGDTLILTDKGYQRIDLLVDQEISIWNGCQWSTVTPKITGHDQPMLEISFSDGSKLKCTHYHKFVLKSGERIEAKKLKTGYSLEKQYFPVIENGKSIDEKIAYTQGLFMGDGGTETNKDRCSIFLYGEKKDLIEYLEYKGAVSCPSKNDALFVTLDYDPKLYNKEFVPFEYDLKGRLDWLAGYIDSDGSINDAGGSISITSCNRETLMNVKMLLNTLGCSGTVSLAKESNFKELPNGKGDVRLYMTQKSYRLTISASSVAKLRNSGLNTHRVKLFAKPDRDASRFIKIVDVQKILKNEPLVYCFNEPKNHTGVFNGIMTGNCGEQPLLPYEACNLGSINLSNFYVDDPKLVTINIDKLEVCTQIATFFLDCIIDAGRYPLPEIDKKVKETRKIGLGIMGFASLLYKIGVPYSSKEGRDIAEKLMSIIQKESHNASSEMGEWLGNFPAWENSEYAGSINKLHGTTIYPRPMRNALTTTIAPTGTISIIADAGSYGIEPVFALHYTKRLADGGELIVVNPILEEYISKNIRVHPTKQKELVDVIKSHIAEYGTLRGGDKTYCTPEIAELIKIFETAGDIDPLDHIRMQAAFQKHIDNAVSKTINFGNSVTVQQIQEAYKFAHKSGCKGITVYRDGCLDSQPMITGSSKCEEIEEKVPENINIPTGEFNIRPRPETLYGVTRTVRTGCGKMYVTINRDINGEIFEMFMVNGSVGGCDAHAESTARLASNMLRGGFPVEFVAKQLMKVRCLNFRHQTGKDPTLKGKSCPDVAGKFLMEVYNENLNKEKNPTSFDLTLDYGSIQIDPEISKTSAKLIKEYHIEDYQIDRKNSIRKNSDNPCPDCGNELKQVEGCLSCECGYSRC